MVQELELLYKDKVVGTVGVDQADFPGSSGQVTLNIDTVKREKEIKDYIDFSIESSDKVLLDNEAYEEYIDEEEYKHQSIIDSLDWTLIAKDGTRTRILVPVFLSDNGINFRFQ